MLICRHDKNARVLLVELLHAAVELADLREALAIVIDRVEKQDDPISFKLSQAERVHFTLDTKVCLELGRRHREQSSRYALRCFGF